MINKFKLLCNVGCFDSVSTGDNLPLEKLTLLYAENGRGKTTLAAILRSLRTNNPVFIDERKRLGSPNLPHVIVRAGGNLAAFQNGAWDRPFSDIEIFDDVFVEQNVYSGLVVGSGHRKNLHELILGETGIALNGGLKGLVETIEKHNQNLRKHEGAIPASIRGNLSVDAFCALPPNSDVDQEIKKIEKLRAAFHKRNQINSTSELQPLDMPEMQPEEIQQTLNISGKDFDAAVIGQVRNHLNTLGDGAERWVEEGVKRQEKRSKEVGNKCVFCAQDLSRSPVIDHYKAFFSTAYRSLQRDISQTIANHNRAHSAEAVIACEQAISRLTKNQQFWTQFADIPQITIDLTGVTTAWKNASDALGELFTEKLESPLAMITIPENTRAAMQSYETCRGEIAVLNQQIADSNQTIAKIKQEVATISLKDIEAKLSLLKTTKARYTPEINDLCRTYCTEKQEKATTKQQRDQAREELNQYRQNIFPQYETVINKYLRNFNVGYRLGSIQPTNTRSGSTCTYNVVINNIAIAVGGGAPHGEHSFRNVLSAGDRNTLALAFFLASLELSPARANKVVVIDDPVSSLDEHRSLTTVQEVRRLVNQVSQVVILSHSKQFLCQVWGGASFNQKVALQVVRQGTASTITAWNVNADLVTENDRRHEILRDYLTNGGQNEQEIAAAIRLCLEAFFRVAYPKHFPPGTMLGSFAATCGQHVGTEREILSQSDIDELKDIIDYANQFHHDTQVASGTGTINSEQLEGFVRRALKLAKRPLRENTNAHPL